MARTVIVAVLVGVTAAVATGCSSSYTSSSSTTTTTVQVETKGFAAETPDGQASISLDGLLPPNWPAQFPVAPDTTPAGSGSLGGTTKGALVGVYTSTAAPEDAYRFYKSSSAYTIDSASSFGTGSAFAGTVSFTGAYSGSATIVTKDDKVYVVVVVNTTGTTTTTAA